MNVSMRWSWWVMVVLAALGLVVEPLYFARALPVPGLSDAVRVALIFLPFAVASIGLLLFKDWSRILYIICCAVFSAIALGREPLMILLTGGSASQSMSWRQYLEETFVPNLPSLLLSAVIIVFLCSRRVAREFRQESCPNVTR